VLIYGALCIPFSMVGAENVMWVVPSIDYYTHSECAVNCFYITFI